MNISCTSHSAPVRKRPCLPCTSNSNGKQPTISLIGVGGAGTMIIERLRGLNSFPPSIRTLTARRPEQSGHADLRIASNVYGPETDNDAQKVLAAVKCAETVIVVGGLGGKWIGERGTTGVNLLPHFVRAAKLQNAKVIAVWFLPFEFEFSPTDRRAGSALNIAIREITMYADASRYVRLQRILDIAPIDGSFYQVMEAADGLALRTIVDELNTATDGTYRWR